jgi:Cytochrome oxidase complex assembly protein 1
MLVLAAGLVFVIISIVFGAMKSSDAYKTALAKAKADPRVVNALGFPITDGFFIGGETNVNGTSGHADVTVPISGPNGKGTIYFVAAKFAGQWTFSKLMVEVANTGQRIDLIEDPSTTVP